MSIGAFVVGAIVLFLALPLGITDYPVPLPVKDGPPLNKQVGIWLGSINWVVEFLVIFPLLVFLVVKMATTVRDVIADLNSKGLIVNRGTAPSHPTAAYHQRLEEFLAGHPYAIDLIAIGTFCVTFLLWFGAAGKDIITCSTGDRLIFWGNGIVLYNKCANGGLVLAYSLLAYAWLGVFVFTYASALLFCILYSSFLSKLFSGRLSIGEPD
jgi:hypothetical protein